MYLNVNVVDLPLPVNAFDASTAAFLLDVLVFPRDLAVSCLLFLF